MAFRNILRLGRCSRSLINLRNQSLARPIYRYQENVSSKYHLNPAAGNHLHQNLILACNSF